MIQDKINDFFLFTTAKGWMYSFDTNVFKPGDLITDGIKEYRIRAEEPLKWMKSRFAIANDTRPKYDGYIYCFDERIDNYENKIFTSCTVVESADAPSCLGGVGELKLPGV